jgi:SAM-dependent methyltransferase
MEPSARETFFARCPVCAGERFEAVSAFPEILFVRCVECGVIYKREQRVGLGHGYEDEFVHAGGPKYMRRWAHRVRKCRRQVQACLEFAPQARTLLDVGCSTGYVLAAAGSLGLEATGLDFSWNAARHCLEKGYRAVQGELGALPFGSASFDVVMLKAVLEHIPDPMIGLQEAARVLRPGGVIFVVVPDGDYFQHAVMPQRTRNFRPDARGWQHHVYFHSPSFARACQRTGLRVAREGRAVLRRRPEAALPFPLEQMRWLGLAAWSSGARFTRLRRDIQAFVVRG